MLNKIRGWLFGKKDNKEVVEETTQIESSPEKVEETTQIDKFDAEFHNPRLKCFYCNESIESGKIRFFKAPGQSEDSAFHKRCFKKLKSGKLPQ